MRLSLFTSLLLAGAPVFSCAAQGIRAVTRPTLMTPASGIFFQVPLAAGAPAPASVPQVVWPVALAPAPSGPPIATKEEVARNTLSFQEKRAAAGAAHAQYDLGVRYQKGDGVDRDLKLARKWLAAAAMNGHSLASKKLEELEKKSD
jgi:hypothetical protein